MKQPIINYHIKKSGPIVGHVLVPGDKSISHRAAMLAAIAEGESHLRGFLEARDSMASLNAVKAMGVDVEHLGPGHFVIKGVGKFGLTPPQSTLDFGNSGTSMRLMAGILAAQPFDTVLTGDESLLRRPMNRIVNPLMQMGAVIETQPQGKAPLTIRGGHALKGIHYTLPIASAQVKSSLLLAGMYAEGETEVIETTSTRDHTERMLRSLGYPIKRSGPVIKIKSEGTLTGGDINIPSDMSGAAFFIVAAAISEGSDLLLEQVGINPYRIGILNILRLMGAKIEVGTEYMMGEEPVADIRVRFAKLRGIDIPMDQVPIAIDEFPALFIACACASGVSTLRGANELRVKESDRILAMANALRDLGIKAEALPDGITIEGGQIKGGRVKTFNDHRVAMACSLAGIVAEEEVIVEDCSYVATSFPNFLELAQQIGMDIHAQEK